MRDPERFKAVKIELASNAVVVVREPEPKNVLVPAPGYHYRIRVADEPKRRGFADLTFHSAAEFQERRVLYQDLKSHGIRERDLVADIVNFYPHGRRTEGMESELFRKGVGGALFDLMLDDCKQHGVSAIIAYTTTDEIRCFLQKRSFVPLEASQKTHRLLMNRSSQQPLAAELLFSADGDTRDS